MLLVYAVLEKDPKIKEFLEKELPECGKEMGAIRIPVAIFKHQCYTPILGESPKINPEIIWDEENPFMSFSYNLVNQRRGFVEIQKKLPPLMLHCDRRKYYMLRLNISSPEKPPEDHIFSYGREIVPLPCAKFSIEKGLFAQPPPLPLVLDDNISESTSEAESSHLLRPRSPLQAKPNRRYWYSSLTCSKNLKLNNLD